MMVAESWVHDRGEIRGETPTRTPRLTSGPWLLKDTIEQNDPASHSRDPEPAFVVSLGQTIEVAPTAWAQDQAEVIEVVGGP